MSAAPDAKMRPLKTRKDVADTRDWLVARRFIEEVHRIEREGRVKSRGELERRLNLPQGYISRIARGQVLPRLGSIWALWNEYNADHRYISIGVRDEDHSGWRRGGQDLRVNKGYKPNDEGQDPYKNWLLRKEQEDKKKAPPDEVPDGAGS